jgi:hypothetical protein
MTQINRFTALHAMGFCMLACAVLFMTATPAGAQERFTRAFQKTLTLGAGQPFHMENKFGMVKIHGEPGREVKINATISAQAGSHSDAELYAGQVQIEVEQTAQGIAVHTVYPEKNAHGLGRHTSYSTDYDIAVPADTPVSIKNSFGSVDAADLHGASVIDNNNGSIHVRNSAAVRISNSFGSIDLTGAAGDAVINGSYGPVRAADVKGSLEIHNRFGTIVAERIGGSAILDNFIGTVTAREVKGNATTKTSFSGVLFEGIGGRISVENQNGAISVASHPANTCHDISLKTSFSSIRLALPAGIGYNVAARTSFGRVSSELPVTVNGAASGESLNGTIGSGGCQLQLTDSNGSIEIVKTAGDTH